MKRFAMLATVLLLAAACGSKSPSSPSNANVVNFTAILLPSNEVPAITNADANSSGTMQLKMNLTRDSGGAISSATGDFTVNLTGFPANTTLTGAHIHPGVAGVNGGVIVSLGLTTGEFVLSSGQMTFSKNSITIPAATAQQILDNPAAFYFNVHTTINTGGATRGQLVKAS
jgi:hypothetical protein